MTKRKPPVTRHDKGSSDARVTRHETNWRSSDVTRHTDDDPNSSVTRHASTTSGERQKKRRERLRSEGLEVLRVIVPRDRKSEVGEAVKRYLAGETQALAPSVDPSATATLQQQLDSTASALLARFVAVLMSPHPEVLKNVQKRVELLESDAAFYAQRSDRPGRK